MLRPGDVPLLVKIPLLAVAVTAVALSSVAQGSQYTAPGTGGGGAEPSTREQVEQQMEDARWRLGPVRLAPWFGIRGITWEQDVFVADEGETSDLTGSVGAGISAYLPTGPDVFWIAQVMPEYLWWLDLDDRNQLIGRYGAGVLADLNRLRVEANVQRTEQQQVVTVESPQQVLLDSRGASLVAELDLSTAFSLGAGLRSTELRQELPGDEDGRGRFDFSRLDRDETVLRGELLYRPREGVEVGAGVERTDTEFATGARNLSNTGTSPYLSLRLDGNRLALDAEVVRRELEPEPGSALQPVDQTQGRARLTFTPGWRFTFGVYGSRHTTYALDLAYSHLTDERIGAEVGAPFGDRLRVRAFYEQGSADFDLRQPLAPPPGGVPAAQGRRSDDLEAYGAEGTYRLGEWLSYRAGLHQVTIESNLPGFDRDYVRVTSSFVLSTGDWAWR